MEEEEYEAKFEEEKEKLVAQFRGGLAKQKDFRKPRERFTKRFMALLKKYNITYEKKEKSEKLKKRLARPFNKAGEQIDRLVELFKEKT